MSCDDETLYLGRSLADLTDLCIAKHALDRVLLGVSVSAVDLNCLDRSTHRQLRTVKLGNRGLLTERLLVLRQPGCVKHQVLSGFDLGRNIVELELNALKTGDRLSELLAEGLVAKRLLESAFGDTDLNCRNPDA